jgi:hypothetical protein
MIRLLKNLPSARVTTIDLVSLFLLGIVFGLLIRVAFMLLGSR